MTFVADFTVGALRAAARMFSAMAADLPRNYSFNAMAIQSDLFPYYAIVDDWQFMESFLYCQRGIRCFRHVELLTPLEQLAEIPGVEVFALSSHSAPTVFRTLERAAQS